MGGDDAQGLDPYRMENGYVINSEIHDPHPDFVHDVEVSRSNDPVRITKKALKKALPLRHRNRKREMYLKRGQPKRKIVARMEKTQRIEKETNNINVCDKGSQLNWSRLKCICNNARCQCHPNSQEHQLPAL